jgi:hypothetical protein
VNAPPARDPVVHRNLAVLEVDDPALLDELSVNPKVRQYLWHRFDARRMVIDPAAVDRVAAAVQGPGRDVVTRIDLDGAP